MRDLRIPAKESWYAGVLFRSRTEAKWACFWDQLDIKWEFEPQGFVAAGVPYLPDFATFPALGLLWVEIKPTWQADPDGVRKWRNFAMRRPNPERSRAALFAGPPSLEGDYLVIGGDDSQDDPLKGAWEDDTQQWRPCDNGHHYDLTYPGLFRAKFVQDGCETIFSGASEDRLRKAVETANSYRFGNPPTGSAA